MKKKDLLRQRRHIKIRAKVSGTAERPRLVVFRSLTHTSAQLVDDDQGVTLVSISDKGTQGTPTERAIHAGNELAQAAIQKKITTCVFDRNGYHYHGRIKALAEAAREAGLKF